MHTESGNVHGHGLNNPDQGAPPRGKSRISDERHRVLAEHMKDVLWTLDMHTMRFTYVSPSVLQLRGYTAEEVMAAPLEAALLPDDARAIGAYLQVEMANYLAGNALPDDRHVTEVRQPCRDGSLVCTEVVTSLMRNEETGHIEVHGVTRDITARKQAELALVLAKERAEKSERLKDAFIANISHELRTPLNTMLGCLSVIKDTFLPDATCNERRYFDLVERGADRLLRSVDMILSMSRLQSGDVPVAPVPIDLAQLLQDIVSEHRPLAQKKGLGLSFTDECRDAVVMADAFCVGQAVGHILHNAIKFTMRGCVELRVYRDGEGRPCIACRDTGIGISKEYLPSLFTRYSQEQHGDTRPFQGLGLGMALVREYLALAGADIAVESERGVGTTCIMTFSNGEAPACAHAAERLSGSAPAAREEPREEHPVALVVEDDDMTLDFMRCILENRYAILEARSVAEAWTALQSRRVDIILLDISLADGRNGLELAQEIRHCDALRLIPIIAVTAHAYDSDRDSCLDAGCDDFLRKPVSSRVLLEAMERLLKSKQVCSR